MIIIKYNSYSILFCILIYIFLVIREYISSFEYLLDLNLSKEEIRIEELLFNLMPPHVVQNLKEDIPVVDVLSDNITFLFADICGFTDYSATVEPHKVVELITELFEDIDKTCSRCSVYKVHTIGDCYVVMGWTGKVPMHERNPVQEAKNVVNLARIMVETIERVRDRINFAQLNMRIGIHTVI